MVSTIEQGQEGNRDEIRDCCCRQSWGKLSDRRLPRAACSSRRPRLITGRLSVRRLLDDRRSSSTRPSARDRQYAPPCPIPGRRSKCLRELLKGAEKPEVVLVEFYEYACPYCKASNPHVDQLVREIPIFAWSIANSPFSVPNSVGRPLSLAASKRGGSNNTQRPLCRRRPAPDTMPRLPHCQYPATPRGRGNRGGSRRTSSCRSARRDGKPLFVGGRSRAERAVGYEALKKASRTHRRRADHFADRKSVIFRPHLKLRKLRYAVVVGRVALPGRT